MPSNYPFGNNYLFISKPKIINSPAYAEAGQIVMDDVESATGGSNTKLGATEASYGFGKMVASTPSHTA